VQAFCTSAPHRTVVPCDSTAFLLFNTSAFDAVSAEVLLLGLNIGEDDKRCRLSKGHEKWCGAGSCLSTAGGVWEGTVIPPQKNVLAVVRFHAFSVVLMVHYAYQFTTINGHLKL